jgi:hypothetical protein
MVAAACRGDTARTSDSAGSSAAAAVRPASPAADTQSVIAAPSGVKPICPVTGHWMMCSVIERLERAGVTTRLDSVLVSEPPLVQRGRRVQVGRAEMLVFFYEDSTARVADEARLDRTRYVGPSQGLSMRAEATLIGSDNLLAILKTRNETQRERVALAITAGPPQPRR